MQNIEFFIKQLKSEPKSRKRRNITRINIKEIWNFNKITDYVNRRLQQQIVSIGKNSKMSHIRRSRRSTSVASAQLTLPTFHGIEIEIKRFDSPFQCFYSGIFVWLIAVIRRHTPPSDRASCDKNN